MKNHFMILAALVACFFLTNCKKDNTIKNITPLNSKTFVVNASSSSKWIYFSFESGDTVQIANPTSSTGWDIAFQRFNLKTNSGLSGIGIGGASGSGQIGTSGFEALLTVSDTLKYASDDSISVIGAQGTPEKIAANNTLSSWYDYNFATNVLTTKGIVYVIKTATGKYAKFIILNYYKEVGGTPAYIKFSYFYQSSGSKALQ